MLPCRDLHNLDEFAQCLGWRELLLVKRLMDRRLAARGAAVLDADARVRAEGARHGWCCPVIWRKGHHPTSRR